VKLVWTSEALHDLERAHDYIADRDETAAAALVTRILDAVEHLSEHPDMGRPAKEEGVRDFVVSGTKYLMPYIVRGEAIVLLAVLHGARERPELP